MAQTIAIFGAGGKMGCRITDNFRGSAHTVLYVEVSPAGVERLASRGLGVTSQEEAVATADVIRAKARKPDVGRNLESRNASYQIKPARSQLCPPRAEATR